MRLTLACALAALTLAACETTPAPVVLTEAEFNEALTTAKAEWHPYLTIEDLTQTLDTATLSDVQRAHLLFERGKTRRLERINVPAAITDFDSAIPLITDEGMLENLSEEKAFATNDVAQIEARLGGLQNFSNWFSDTVAMGRIPEVVERLKASGLTPSEEQARLLEAAGYLCKGVGDEPSEDFTLGDTGHLTDMNWCETPAES